MKISIVITTWNRAEFLRRALYGYLRQTEKDFEIVVADDGSEDHTPDVVKEFQEKALFPVKYIRQELEGHRRAEAINRGVAAAQHAWILFSDCDAVPHRDLVAVHRHYAEPDRLLCGERIRLDKEYTESLTLEMIQDGDFEKKLTKYKKIQLVKQHLKNQFYILQGKKRRPHNYGLNMSCSREAFDRVNGYDHNFRGWGNADGDLRDRMRMVGIKPKSIAHKAIVFHQWHPTHSTRALRLNKEYARRNNIKPYCEKGLDEIRFDTKGAC